MKPTIQRITALCAVYVFHSIKLMETPKPSSRYRG